MIEDEAGSRARRSEDLAEELREACRRGAKLPGPERRAVLKCLLAHRMAGWQTNEALDALRRLHDSFQGTAEPVPVSRQGAPSPSDEDPWNALDALLREVWGGTGNPDDLLSRAEATRGWLAEQVRSLGKRAGMECGGLKDLLDGFGRRLDKEREALQRAAQEAFDRLLESMDPETVRRHAEGTGWKVGPFQKASLFGTWEEKYGQLKAYHERGRLVGDLRAAYRKYAAGEGKNEEGE